jgi:Ca2+-binding EF-hand superfamily protein
MLMLAAGVVLAIGGTAAHADALNEMLGNNSPIPEFKDVDDNRDGFVTREEAKESNVTVAKTMYQYDDDKDGQLSEAEFSALESKEPSSAEYWHDFFSLP